MLTLLRTAFAFILNPLEAGNAPYAYKRSHRHVLIGVGVLALSLATGVILVGAGRDLASLFPGLVFGLGGLFALVIGLVGNDRAVAKLWGNVHSE